MRACCWTLNAGPPSCHPPPCNEAPKEHSCMWSTLTERLQCDRSRSESPIPMRYPSIQVWLPRNSSWSTALRNCERAAKWKSRTRTAYLGKAEPISRSQELRRLDEWWDHESVPSVYPTSRCDGFVDGCDSPCRIYRLPAATGFGSSPSRLSDHSGAHFL